MFNRSIIALLNYKLDGLEATLVDRLKLHTEEHRSDVRENERFVLLDHNGLGVGHLVVANEHVRLGADVNELGICLVEERNDVKTVVRPLYSHLIELRVVHVARVRKLVGIVVLVGEVLRAEEVAILSTQTRVERIEDLLSQIISIFRGYGLSKFEVVTLFRGDSALGNLLLGDGVEAIEEVHGRVAIRVTFTLPNGVVEILRR